MSQMIDDVKAALIDLTVAMKGPDTRRMTDLMGRLDGLLERHRDTMDGRLVHFLSQRSYAKALAFVGGEGAVVRGSCGTGSGSR